MLNILAVLLASSILNNMVSLPLIFFSVAIVFYRNGYVLHQLFIFVTSFISINIILSLLDLNLIFSNFIFLWVVLNMVFYPLLERNSNSPSRYNNINIGTASPFLINSLIILSKSSEVLQNISS